MHVNRIGKCIEFYPRIDIYYDTLTLFNKIGAGIAQRQCGTSTVQLSIGRYAGQFYV